MKWFKKIWIPCIIVVECIYKKEKILMSKFIEKFYYGNLDPQSRSTKVNKTVQKQMEVLILNEDT